MVEAKPAQFFRTRGGTPGPARRALETALVGRNLTGIEAVTAAIARDAADLVDSARRQQDPRLWLSASGRLLALAGQLDERPPAVPDDGGGDRAEPDDPDGLGAALGTGPTVGDAADA